MAVAPALKLEFDKAEWIPWEKIDAKPSAVPEWIHRRRWMLGRKSVRLGRWVFKAVLDFSLALVLILMLLPGLFLLATAVVVFSRQRPIYSQQRLGRNGRVFRIFKYRSMCAGAHAQREQLFGRNQVDGVLFKMAQDPRETRFGRWLRHWDLDELPQLLNILLGQMSLVGPRPFSVEVFARVPPELALYNLWKVNRHRVRPGLTGLWQVSGRNQMPFDEQMLLDLYYVRNWSPWLDLWILLRTPAVVVLHQGSLVQNSVAKKGTALILR